MIYFEAGIFGQKGLIKSVFIIIINGCTFKDSILSGHRLLLELLEGERLYSVILEVSVLKLNVYPQITIFGLFRRFL